MKYFLNVIICCFLFSCAGEDLESKNRYKKAKKKKILFLAGKDGHGFGVHEFSAGLTILKELLEKQKGFRHKIETYLFVRGKRPSKQHFKDVDALIFFCNGRGGHLANQYLKTVDSLVNKGVGILMMHYAVDPHSKYRRYFAKWMGGYYEDKFSTNPIWILRNSILADSPITNGVNKFSLKDEWYFNIRFKKRIKPILSGIPSYAERRKKNQSRQILKHIKENIGRKEVVMWSYERAHNGRSIGFTGGHFHASWKNEDFRKLILNAVAWVSHLPIPKKGLDPLKVSEKLFMTNHSKKKKKK